MAHDCSKLSGCLGLPSHIFMALPTWTWRAVPKNSLLPDVSTRWPPHFSAILVLAGTPLSLFVPGPLTRAGHAATAMADLLAPAGRARARCGARPQAKAYWLAPDEAQ